MVCANKKIEFNLKIIYLRIFRGVLNKKLNIISLYFNSIPIIKVTFKKSSEQTFNNDQHSDGWFFSMKFHILCILNSILSSSGISGIPIHIRTVPTITV